MISLQNCLDIVKIGLLGGIGYMFFKHSVVEFRFGFHVKKYNHGRQICEIEK